MPKLVERTLDCFELFADQKQPLSLSEVSRLLKIPTSSCYELLTSLRKRGYLYELAPRAGYYPTLRLHNVASTIAANDPVLMRASVLLRSLHDALDETVTLAKASGLEATYLLAFDSSQPLRLSIQVGDALRSLYATSAGKALLANLDERSLANFLKSAELKKLTPRTVASKAALREQIAEGRRLGYFVNCEESVAGVTTLSAVFNWQQSLYLVTIAGPSPRIEPKITWASHLLMDVCKRLQMQGEPDRE